MEFFFRLKVPAALMHTANGGTGKHAMNWLLYTDKQKKKKRYHGESSVRARFVASSPFSAAERFCPELAPSDGWELGCLRFFTSPERSFAFFVAASSRAACCAGVSPIIWPSMPFRKASFLSLDSSIDTGGRRRSMSCKIVR